jgi:D-beta-D-heptose 7-phosphate kinase/D-beta-D-heptose 1-phosphate adenosyltransferase
VIDLADWLSHLDRPSILVIGDLILDAYTWGTAERLSPEAPVVVLRATGDENRLGGAASVAALLIALGCNARLAGMTGTDSHGQQLRRLIDDSQISLVAPLDEPDRPTTVKHRFMAQASGGHPQQVLRVDRETRQPIRQESEKALTSAIETTLPEVQAVFVSDYGKGVCTPPLLSNVFQLGRAHHLG